MPTASAPASSANLGPGFDVLALALELRCIVSAEPADRWQVTHIGPERPPEGPVDLVMEAARMAYDLGPPLHLTIDNRIPIGKGLGSSAAAAAAGVTAAFRANGLDPDPREVFELVAQIEEHPDNAAAAVYGGLVLCGAGGEVNRLPWKRDLVPLVAIPDRSLSTSEARGMLPEVFPRETVVRSLGRVSALVAGMILSDPRLLAAASDDELHEAPRNRHHPEAARLISAARGAGALHAAWSGAGPSVIALATENAVAEVSDALQAALGEGTVRRFVVAETGLK